MKKKNLPYHDKSAPWSSHAFILKELSCLPKGTKVLDVGTASGTIGRGCAGKGLILHGIEPEADWAEIARPFYAELLTTNIEDAPDEFLSDHTVIICADVLEHLPNPLQALQRLVRLQNAQSAYLISVPNVANIWLRLSLMLGRFEYTDRGILDKTHLRFFTRATFLELIKQANLEVVRMLATPIPLNLVHPVFDKAAWGRFSHRCLAGITRLLPTLLGYQFVVLARRSAYDRK